MAVNKLVESLLSKAGLPISYREFRPYKNKPVPKPPYIIYLIDNESGRGADGKNLFMRKRVTAELYSNTKNTSLEAAVEQAISAYEFEKYEDYISDEKMYLTSYEFEIYEKIRRN